MNRKTGILTVAVSTFLFVNPLIWPAHALLGIGAHKGVDFSLDMNDAAEPFELDGVMLTIGSPAVSVLDSSAGYTLMRSGWKRTPMNFGGKFYIDIIPVIDAVEISCNFGVWHYECSFTYPQFDQAAQSLRYETAVLSLDSMGLEPKWGVHDMPYAKLHADLTVRKYIVRVPKDLKLLNLYAGGGFNVFMSTPMLTEKMVRERLGLVLAPGEYNMTNPIIQERLTGENMLKDAIREITQGLTERRSGIHFTAGAIFQVPVIPLSIYADTKLLIPFTELSKDAGLGGYGFVLNAGVALSVTSERTKNTEGFE